MSETITELVGVVDSVTSDQLTRSSPWVSHVTVEGETKDGRAFKLAIPIDKRGHWKDFGIHPGMRCAIRLDFSPGPCPKI